MKLLSGRNVGEGARGDRKMIQITASVTVYLQFSLRLQYKCRAISFNAIVLLGIHMAGWEKCLMDYPIILLLLLLGFQEDKRGVGMVALIEMDIG